jgi:phage recombination protein Bet
MANIPQDRAMTYNVGGTEIKLTPSIVKNYLVNGNGNVTDREIVQFMTLCRYQNINPFLREAYLIKYGNSDATIVTGKDFFMKRARQAPDMEGFRAGVIVGTNGDTEETEGFVPEGKKIVGGWAEVYVQGWKFPVKVQVPFEEYVGRKRDGSVTAMWKNKPATMIRKVALVQALREAFPGLYGGLYSPEEIDTVDSNALAETPIDVTPAEKPNPNAAAAGRVEIMDNAAAREADNKPTFRSRRNTQTVNGKEIKTCGVTGKALEYVKQQREQYPDIIKPVIHGVVDRLQIQDITFLREDEGDALVDAITTAMANAAKADPEVMPEEPPDLPPVQDTPPPNMDTAPPQEASEPQEATNGNESGFVHCPDRNQRISTKICEARCDKKDKCQAYQEAMFDGGAE